MRKRTFPILLAMIAGGCADEVFDKDAAKETGAPISPPASAEEIRSIENAVTPKVLTKTEHNSYLLHTEITDHRPSTPADSARVAAIVDSIKGAIGKWKDPEDAAAAGFVAFDPETPQDEYHFLRRNYSLRDNRLNYESPSALLFKTDKSGSFYLVGAMYSTPGRLSPSALDSLIPLSHAQWHRHVKWCLPPLDRQERWAERDKEGNLIFGLFGVSTRKDCDRVGGMFRTDMVGWMTHAYVYDKDVWGGKQMGAMRH